MKYSFNYNMLVLFACILLAGCEKDNYQAPASLLTGQVVYQDSPIGVRSNGVQLELWQQGYEQPEKIPVYLAQDGSFSASVFDGNYKLVLLRGNGPWIDNTDTIDVEVRGATSLTVPVNPYYLVNDAGFNHADGTLTATFSILTAAGSRDLEGATLFVGTTTIVDANNNAARVGLAGTEIIGTDGPLSLSMDLTGELAGRAYVFARIGVKTTGVAEMLYSPVQKIEL